MEEVEEPSKRGTSCIYAFKGQVSAYDGKTAISRQAIWTCKLNVLLFRRQAFFGFKNLNSTQTVLVFCEH